MNSLFIQTKCLKENPSEYDWLNPYSSELFGCYIQRERGNALIFLPSTATGIALSNADIFLCENESDMLKRIWDSLKTLEIGQKEQLVTYNGRKFAAPFLYTRSFLNQVPAGHSELLRDRYKAFSEHLDLVEALTFHHITQGASLLELSKHFKLPMPVITEGTPLAEIIATANKTKTPQLWEIIAKSGLVYAGNTLEVAKIWSKTLRSVY